MDPSVVSEAIQVSGYGVRTPGGVAGVGIGVKHRSGKTQFDLPVAASHDTGERYER